MKPIIAILFMFLVGCGEETPPQKQVLGQAQTPVSVTVTLPEIQVVSTPEERAKSVAENEADWQKVEFAISKLSDSEYGGLVSNGMPDWKSAIQRHKALKKLSDEDMKALEIDDKMSLENGD